MVNDRMERQDFMDDTLALEDLLKIKELVNQMELRDFKEQWDKRSNDYTTLDRSERMKYMLMSIKILQADADLKRMKSSLKELSAHPEPRRAIYYYLRANLWKFLDNFHYILLVEDIRDVDKLECIDLLDQLTELIVQDEDLKQSCLKRLSRLHKQIQSFGHRLPSQKTETGGSQIRQQLGYRIVQLMNNLTPTQSVEESADERISQSTQEVIAKYLSFSVSRISIEKSGVNNIIQLLHDYPLVTLKADRAQLEKTLETLEQQVLYDLAVSTTRNQCAYALVILLEILKMHEGLPVLLSRIFDLCSYIQFPSPDVSLDRELRELKGRVAEISQKKLRPIIEDVLWKNPAYLKELPHIRTACPWCYRKDKILVLNISYIRKTVSSSFDRMESATVTQFPEKGVVKSHLSEMVIEILGLLVNLEPSPRFLKLHSQETRLIKQANTSDLVRSSSREKLLDKQYTTYKNHLKFLHDSIDYYQGISEEMEVLAKTDAAQ
jgi:hypothetical protein